MTSASPNRTQSDRPVVQKSEAKQQKEGTTLTPEMIENIKAHAWPEAYKPPELSESEKVLAKTAYVILSSKFLYLQTVA